MILSVSEYTIKDVNFVAKPNYTSPDGATSFNDNFSSVSHVDETEILSTLSSFSSILN